MFQSFNQTFKSLNLRTTYALIVLATLLGFVVVAEIHETADRAAAVRTTLSANIARHGGNIDEAIWRERSGAAQEALSAWNATRWSGATSGIAAAALQSELNQITNAANVNVLSLQVDPAPIELPEGNVLQFRIALDSTNAETVANLLSSISTHQPMIIINEMSAAFDDNSAGRLSLAGFAPISLTTNQTAEDL